MKKLFLILVTAASLFSCSNSGNEEHKGLPADSAMIRMQGPLSPNAMEMTNKEGENNAPKESPYKNAKIDVKVFENKEGNLTGFGYDIYIHDALYVHQPHIPAINGNRGFHTKEQAGKTADFVVYKIRNNVMPPSLSVEELDSLGSLK